MHSEDDSVIAPHEHPVYNASNIESIQGQVDEGGDYRGEGRVTYANGDYEASRKCPLYFQRNHSFLTKRAGLLVRGQGHRP